MNLHDRNWEGLGILILGSSPLVPAKIEQSIAGAFPATEAQLASFENFPDAFKYCKSNRNVGFILLQDNWKETPFISVFRELASNYQAQQLPCFGAILYDESPNSFTERAISKDARLLDYLSIESLIDRIKIAPTMSRLWDQYVTAFESSVIPKALQDSILSLATEKYGEDGVRFILRTAENLLSEVNASWLEAVAAKWSPFLSAVEGIASSVLKPHPSILYLLELSRPATNIDAARIVTYLGGSDPVWQKVSTLACYLNNCRESSALEALMDKFAILNKPGAPKLIRHVSKNRDRIISFTSETKVLKSEVG